MIVAFDIDDTLVKEREFCRSGFRAVSEMLASLINPEEVYQAMNSALEKRGNHYDALEKLLDERGLNDKVQMKDVVEICRNHKPRFSQQTIDRARQMIQNVNQEGYIPAIITDGRTVTQRNKLEGLGIYELISPEDILISSEQGADKRESLMFRRLMELHPGKTRFTYIGDNTSKDFYWPKRLGWQTIGIRDREGTNIHPQSLEVNPEYLPDIWI